MTVIARDLIGHEVAPTADGLRLAKALIERRVDVAGLEIDVTTLAPEDLISSFVNAVFHTLEEGGVSKQVLASVKWVARYPDEQARLDSLVRYYVDPTFCE